MNGPPKIEVLAFKQQVDATRRMRGVASADLPGLAFLYSDKALLGAGWPQAWLGLNPGLPGIDFGLDLSRKHLRQ